MSNVAYIEDAIQLGHLLAQRTLNRDELAYKEGARTWSMERARAACSEVAEASGPERAESFNQALLEALGSHGAADFGFSVTEAWSSNMQSAYLKYSPEKGMPSLAQLRLCCLELLTQRRPLSILEQQLFAALEAHEFGSVIAPRASTRFVRL